MAHAWKACWVKALGGSNPPFSADAPELIHVSFDIRGGTVVDASQMASTTIRVAARGSVLRNTIYAAVAAGIPLFGVLYWLSLAQGIWLRVLVVQVIYTGLVVLIAVRHFGAFVEVTSTTITKQALFVRTTLNRSDAASSYLADTHTSNSPDLLPQLLVLDANGGRLLRMRGTFWSREDMLRVAEAIGVPLTMESEPMTLKEFYARHPGAAYWYEGKLWLAIVGIVLAFGFAYLAVTWLMVAIGVPSVWSL
jgi:hypothetical protein